MVPKYTIYIHDLECLIQSSKKKMYKNMLIYCISPPFPLYTIAEIYKNNNVFFLSLSTEISLNIFSPYFKRYLFFYNKYVSLKCRVELKAKYKSSVCCGAICREAGQRFKFSLTWIRAGRRASKMRSLSSSVSK